MDNLIVPLMKDFFAKLPVEYDNIVLVAGNILKALAIIIAGCVLTRISEKAIKKTFKKGGKAESKLSEKRVETLQAVAMSCVKYLIYFFILYALLDMVSSNTFQPLAMVAGAFGVAVGLGAQDLIKDIIAGFFVIFEDQFSVGDVVEIQGKSGTIEEIGLRTTKIRGFSGELFIVPNGSIQTVTNWAKEFTKASFIIKVPYEEKIERVLTILDDELAQSENKVEGLLEAPKVLGITDMGDYNIQIRITANCKSASNWSVERQLRLRVKVRFEKEGVLPPYPPNHAIAIGKGQ